MRKHPDIVISQVSVPHINLDISSTPPTVVPTPSSVSCAPDQQKYHVDDINEPTPCTLLYVKGRMLRTIEVADAVVMGTRIMHGQPVSSECAMVKVTAIREGCEFENLDYPNDEEGIEKLKDAKGNFILWPSKDIIIKTCSSPIVSLRSREDEGTPTSQNTICSTTANPPSTQPLKHHSRHTTHLQNPPTE
jgi:hypothetical protein